MSRSPTSARNFSRGQSRAAYVCASVRLEPKQFVAEHAEILEAVRAADADGAAERLRDNLGTTEQLLAATYSSREAAPHD